MQNAPQSPIEPRRVGRRQVIVGAGVAAGAWAAPSIMRFDVASASGSSSTVITTTPLSIPAGVTVTPPKTGTILGTDIFGKWGRIDDEGDRVEFGYASPPAHTSITVSVDIIYQSIWETSGAGQDFMDIQVDGVSVPGYPSSNVGTNGQVINYMFTASHSGDLDILIIGDPVALAENFGITTITVEFC